MATRAESAMLRLSSSPMPSPGWIETASKKRSTSLSSRHFFIASATFSPSSSRLVWLKDSFSGAAKEYRNSNAGHERLVSVAVEGEVELSRQRKTNLVAVRMPDHMHLDGNGIWHQDRQNNYELDRHLSMMLA